MKILILTSPVIEATSFSTLEKTPPLGLGYLVAVLRKDGHKVMFKDLYLDPSGLNELEELLVRESVELLGVSINTICYEGGIAALNIAQDLREKKCWLGKIAVGGPHPSVFPETIPEFVDHVIKGEGEEIIRKIANGDHLPRIIEGMPVEDMDALPLVPYEEFITLPYDFTNQWINKNRVLTLNTSRGCPFLCQFCSVGSIWGNCYRYQSAGRIIEEISRLRKDFNAQGVYFREDNFTLNSKRIVEFCEGLLAEGGKFQWICETRANTLSEELIELMARAGCAGFYIGAESGSQRVLDHMKKGITLEQVANVVAWAKKAGIRSYLSFVMGTPTETEKERYDTIQFVDRLKPYSFSINIFTGIPFSSYYWQLLREGNFSLITSGGIIYQEKHNELVERFVGSKNAEVPLEVEDARKGILPLLKTMGEAQNSIVVKATSAADINSSPQSYPQELKKDPISLSNPSNAHNPQAWKSEKKDRAVLQYFLGRVKLRARKFYSARGHFLNAFRSDPSLKHFIFICATVLPARSYSFFSGIINKGKKVIDE